MFKMPRRLLVLVAVLLGGCSAAGQYGVHGDYILGSAPGDGLIAFSTRWAFACRGPLLLPPVNPTLIFEGAGQTLGALLDNPLVARQYEDPPGYFYVLRGKAGDYKVADVRFHHRGIFYSVPFAVPFKVSEKKVTYLGEITVRTSDCQFVVRREDPKIGITATSQWERDRKLFEQRLPKIGMKDVVVDILRP